MQIVFCFGSAWVVTSSANQIDNNFNGVRNVGMEGDLGIQDKTNVLEKKKIRRQSYNAEVSPWENANTNPQTNPVSVGGVPIDKSVDKGDPSSMMGRKRKKISGHIESEDLWKWKNCLVGEWIQSAQLVAFTGDLMRGDWV
ncbi:hypothetical protein V6N11_008333 [Hibiscus sabdariffa]|uniref:Uncharacterized protein n=2 Tax=Hibiscus sabdariffa TaxID=183260 RepID=A0ABR2Q0X9_9ROSI